ncbi:MAG: DUF3466 family protein [Verrucomicrobia bacterium]|nr:DUF3466 family protein [Verrucomicrobiota bacterium]
MKTTAPLIVAFLCLPGLPLAAAPHRLVKLGSLGGTPTTASGINDLGEVVGYASTAGQPPLTFGFLYRSKNAKFIVLSGSNTFPRAISPDGSYIVGASTHLGGPVLRAMLYDVRQGTYTHLGAAGPAPDLASDVFAFHYTPFTGITLVGKSFPSPGAAQPEATRWTGQDLIRQGQGGITRAAYGVNGNGVFVGEKDLGGGNVGGFATFPGSGILDLPNLGGTRTQPAAINNLNQIVGSASLPGDDNFHAFLLKAGDAALVDLGAFGPSANRNSRATAINVHGQVVGWSEFQDDSDDRRAFLYEKGRMIDLNTLLAFNDRDVTLTEATGINRYGQIVGFGTLNGFPFPFLLSPPLSFAVAGKKNLTVPENLKRLTFSGTGSITLTGVSYRVGNRGKFLKARGTLRWRFTARLKPGRNIIHIVANAPGIQSKPTKIRVRRR